MSPSESELRAFLHSGEGQPVSPGALIAHARAARHTRRVRIASVAAAVVAVGAIGTGAFALNRSGGGGPTAGDAIAGGSNQDTGSSRQKVPARPAPSQSVPNPGQGSAATTCPTVPPRLMLPGGGGTGQFGGDEPLFDGTITSMQICGYAEPANGGAVQFSRTTLITGQQAGEIASSLNAAPAKQVIGKCSIRQSKALVIYARTASGTDSKPVVVNYSSCSATATNGTAARYDWRPPTDVAKLLDALMIRAPAVPNSSAGPSGKVHGSPVR